MGMNGNNCQFKNIIRKGNKQMLQWLLGFLLFMILSGGFGFAVGVLAGRAIERAQAAEIFQEYYIERDIK